MQTIHKPALLVIPSIPVWVQGTSLTFDKKFYDGMIEYCRLWPGKVSCLMKEGVGDLPPFNLETMNINKIQFECRVISKTSSYDDKFYYSADIILASGDSHEQLSISKICKSLKIPCVYIIENTLRTRVEIIKSESISALRKFVRCIKAAVIEYQRRRAFSLSSGIQANGIPSANGYSKFNNLHLFFDTRASSDDIVSESTFRLRLNHSSGNDKPLRIAYSGRLERLKGAHYLIQVAKILKTRGVNYEMSIFGSGSLAPEIDEKIKSNSLCGFVRMRGPVDFKGELIPELSKNFDIFIMPHTQGDPSCTYLETMACGLPILGFDNPAFSGLLTVVDIGWSVPIGDVDALANKIMEINIDRADLHNKSNKSRNFAKENTFELVFEGRIRHLKNTLKLK